MAIHDLKCASCESEMYDQYIDVAAVPKCTCGGKMEIRWDISQRYIPVAINPTVHTSERAVVYRNPQTGSVAYPPVNNAPMPDRYAKNGYQRVELDTLKKMDTFCKEKNVSNEKVNYNSGNGL